MVSTQPTRFVAWANPIALARNLWHHRDLIIQFTQRDIEGRYRGSFLGILWSFVQPLFLLSIYTFVFGVVFQARWPQARSDRLAEFALIIFSGLLVFNIFSECLIRSPQLITSVPNYVKRVVFPLEILAVSSLGAALFQASVNFLVLLIAEFLILGSIPWTIIWLPIVILPILLISLGLSWFLASLGVFIRDVGQIVGLFLQGLFFFTPIFYAVDAIPVALQPLLLANPLAPAIENMRRVVLWGEAPEWGSVLIGSLVALIVMICGYAWFMKTKKAFADVI
ncbi:MAG: ABC transporter permease [Roseiflexaceae bacterium]